MKAPASKATKTGKSAASGATARATKPSAPAKKAAVKKAAPAKKAAVKTAAAKPAILAKIRLGNKIEKDGEAELKAACETWRRSFKV